LPWRSVPGCSRCTPSWRWSRANLPTFAIRSRASIGIIKNWGAHVVSKLPGSTPTTSSLRTSRSGCEMCARGI